MVLKIFWAEVSIFWAMEVPPWVLPEFLFFMQNLKLISHGTLHTETNYLVILLICYHKAIIWIYNVWVCYIGKPLQVSCFHLFFVWVLFSSLLPLCTIPNEHKLYWILRIYATKEALFLFKIDPYVMSNLTCAAVSFFYLLPKLKWQFMWTSVKLLVHQAFF